MRYKTRKNVRDEILSKESIDSSAYDEADGIFALVLLNEVLEKHEIEHEVEFPMVFGDCGEVDVVLDQVPIDPDLEAIVLDHHVQHLKRRGFKYKLWFEPVPTSLIVYNIFKKDIVSKWKVVAGLFGDGQAELTPNEIWDQYPELLHQKASIYQRSGGLNVYRNSVYTMLSSGIGAIVRMHDEETNTNGPVVAYEVAKQVETPWELMNHPTCRLAKSLQKKSIDSIYFGNPPVDLGNVIFWKINSKFSLEGYVATTLESSEKKAVVVVNEVNRKIALRGVHAQWIQSKLPDFDIDGHLKWMGGLIKDDQTPDDLLQALVERII